MSRIYLYPKNDYKTLDSPNPYMLNVESALSDKHVIINKSPNRIGILDLFKFLPATDIYFLNWIEDVPVKRFGILQVLFLVLFLLLRKALDKKIVWVLHNIYSHESKRRKLIGFVFRRMMNEADLIITHSNEGIEFIRREFPLSLKKARYLIHPMDGVLIKKSEQEKEFDFFIWGTIYPYKGVTEFLRYASKTSLLKELRILVAGICLNDKVRTEVKKLATGNIVYIERFLDFDQIAQLAGKSRFILFTYNSDSVLSSGSLMDSIRMGSVVIGPDKGSFKDLKSLSFISTYSSFDDIISIYNERKHSTFNYLDDAKRFCIQNSWESYGDKLSRVSSGIL